MTNIEFEGAQLKESLIAEQESIGNSIGHEYAREGLFEHLKALKECYVLPDKLFSLRDERGLTILHIAVLKGRGIHGCESEFRVDEAKFLKS